MKNRRGIQPHGLILCVSENRHGHASDKLESRSPGGDISNLGYADDTTLTAESEEELKSILMKVKEESGKSWLKTRHSENTWALFPNPVQF